MLTRTIASDDLNLQGRERVLLRPRDRVPDDVDVQRDVPGLRRGSRQLLGRYQVYSLNPGISFRTDWLSTDRIQLIYGRRFYSHAADPNSAQPYDRNMIALGGYITF